MKPLVAEIDTSRKSLECMNTSAYTDEQRFAVEEVMLTRKVYKPILSEYTDKNKGHRHG